MQRNYQNLEIWYRVASGGVIVHIFFIFDNNSINNKATTLCLHT